MTLTTAEDFMLDNLQSMDQQEVEHAMIEFAKMHVKAALKAKGKAMIEKSYEDSSFSVDELDAFTRDSYPLDNIQ